MLWSRPFALIMLLAILPLACAPPSSLTATPAPPAPSATPTRISDLVSPPLLVTAVPKPKPGGDPLATATPTPSASPPPVTPPAGGAPRAWIELGPAGPIARVVTSAADCPSLTLDGAPRPLTVRARPSPPAFPVLVCELLIPAGTTSVAVAGQALHLPRATPQRIVVLGDTGCRLAGDRLQACNDPAQWPAARIAQAIADWQPDLIIHVGDYLYRERSCPADRAGCANSPWGDTWAAWEADLFGPLAPLLPAAPWIFTRGNHELCERGGDGWFRLLEPRPRPATCLNQTDPYVLRLGTLRLLMLDSALASDTTVPTDQVPVYRRQLDELRPAAAEGAWLITHKPLWGLLSAPLIGARRVGNLTLQAAVGEGLPPGIGLVLSGHIHLAQVLKHSEGPVVQIIAGSGGTLLDEPATPRRADDAASSIAAHGFLSLEPAGAGWTLTIRDTSGRPLSRCTLTPSLPACQPT